MFCCSPPLPRFRLISFFRRIAINYRLRSHLSSTTMSINDLPKCLLASILNDPSIPLQNRIQLRAVSHLWLTIIEEELQKDCITELTLLDHHYDEQNSNGLVVADAKYFNANFFNLLCRLFPLVSDLIVDIYFMQSFHELPKLLSKYSATLKSFSLYGDYDFRDDPYKGLLLQQLEVDEEEGEEEEQEDDDNSYFQVPTDTSRNIAAAINTLTNLTFLKLNAIGLQERLVPFLPPTLARLEHFSFGLPRPPEEYCQILGKIICTRLTDRCKVLELHRVYLVNWPQNNSFGGSVNDLTIRGPYDFNLYNILVNFLNLRKLTIDFSCIEAANDIRHTEVRFSAIIPTSMAPLRYLTDLTLLNLRYTKDAIRRPKPNLPGPSWFDPGIIELPLTSLKRLYLEVSTFEDGPHFDAKYFCMMLAVWFPSLEHLTIYCDEAFHGIIELYLEDAPFNNLREFIMEPCDDDDESEEEEEEDIEVTD